MSYRSIKQAYGQMLTESTEHPMIDVDGQMKHRHNSLGQPIHHTDEGIKNFHRWFGDSKAVDEHGRPQILFHGTGHTLDTFDIAKVGKNYSVSKGFYFSESPDVADEYALTHTNARHARQSIPGVFGGSPADVGIGGANIVPVYLKMHSPLIKRAGGYLSSEQSVDRNIDTWIKKSPNSDGIIILPSKLYQQRAATYVTFHPHQIKSAIGNSGAFGHPTKITESAYDAIATAYIKMIQSKE